MKKIAYHTSNFYNEIILDGIIKPNRMKNVFLIETIKGAELYCINFNNQYIFEVEYNTEDVENSWNPSYIKKEKVIKLKEGKTAFVKKALTKGGVNGDS
jgi:hypothetical protein